MKNNLLGSINLVFLIINTIVLASLVIPLGLLKFTTPFLYKFWNFFLVMLAELWVRNNNSFLSLTLGTKYEYTGEKPQDKTGNYIVISNHQTWVDILLTQRFLNGKIPFIRFFLKQELIYVPIIGLAWWALDYPFLKRHGKDYLEKHPEKKEEDLKIMKKSCKKFARIPSSVLIYVEGTRFSEEKRKKQNSPYEYLLKPKSKGLQTAVSVLGGKFNKIIDITIFYPHGIPSFWDYLSGKVEEIIVDVQYRELPARFYKPQNDNQNETFRQEFQQWVFSIWLEKNNKLNKLRKEMKNSSPFL